VNGITAIVVGPRAAGRTGFSGFDVRGLGTWTRVSSPVGAAVESTIVAPPASQRANAAPRSSALAGRLRGEISRQLSISATNDGG
jgi:hypothetical protein